jgi:hypothetical protein
MDSRKRLEETRLDAPWDEMAEAIAEVPSLTTNNYFDQVKADIKFGPMFDEE